MTRARKYKLLETALGYRFKSQPLLERALTHASVRTAKGPRSDNERLEFIGDRVLGLAIVQKSVEQHGGTLTLEDAPPAPDRTHGAMVRITLPVRHATPNATLKVQPEPAAASGGR